MRTMILITLTLSLMAPQLGQSTETNLKEQPQQAMSVVGDVDHVGLAVLNLALTQQFFLEQLGFQLVGEDSSYPAAFVRNDEILITLWQVADPGNSVSFDRRKNIGLHHMAFRVASSQALDDLYHQFQGLESVKIEFAPELLGQGPAKHMMIYEPGGIRLEFIHRP